jgi:hypothetical protein
VYHIYIVHNILKAINVLRRKKRCLCAGAHLWGDDHGETDGREEGEVGAVHRHVVKPEQHRPVGVGQTTPRLYVSVLQPVHKLSVIFRGKNFGQYLQENSGNKGKISPFPRIHYFS